MRKFGFVIGATSLIAACAWGQNVISARPGLVNYTEGDVQIDGQQIHPKSNGTKLLDRGQVLDTTEGKAEVLLTPGVFLRVGDHSAIRMISSGLEDTQVELQRGEALVEVAELFKGNQVQILNQGSSTTLLKNGLYRFEAGQPAVYVYDGKAKVTSGDRKVEIGKGKEVLLASSKLKATKFDRKKESNVDPLYRWSEVRSGYMAEANVSSARTVVASNSMFAGSGWYWNPFFSAYSFIPGNGIMYSPFGYGFYSPWWVGYAPVYAYRPYPGGGGGSVIAGRQLPPPRVIRPAIPVRGATSSGGSARRAGAASARSSAPVSAAPAARSSAPMGASGGAGGGMGRSGGVGGGMGRPSGGGGGMGRPSGGGGGRR